MSHFGRVFGLIHQGFDIRVPVFLRKPEVEPQSLKNKNKNSVAIHDMPTDNITFPIVEVLVLHPTHSP